MAEERKLAEDNKEMPEEKLGRSHGQQTHTTNNTNTNFAEETNGRAKNYKWTVSYRLLTHRLYEEKRKEKNEEVRKDKVKKI